MINAKNTGMLPNALDVGCPDPGDGYVRMDTLLSQTGNKEGEQAMLALWHQG